MTIITRAGQPVMHIGPRIELTKLVKHLADELESQSPLSPVTEGLTG